jgi:hypothetical protein
MAGSWRAGLLVTTAALIACDTKVEQKPDPGPDRVREVGVPSADIRVVPAPSDLNLPSCDTEPMRDGVGRWRPISNLGAPQTAQAGIWAGNEVVIVNSMRNFPLEVAAYAPDRDTWRTFVIPSATSFERIGPFIGAVGHSLVIYGGYRSPSGPGDYLSDGWLIDMQTGEWTLMNANGAPALRAPADDTLRVFPVGTRLLFVPTSDDDDEGTAAAAYDTVTGRWERVAGPVNAPFFGCSAPGWNGRQVLCNYWQYFFTVSADPLRVETVPRLLDRAIGTAPTIAFVPVGDLFFGYGQPLQDEEEHFVFFLDPTRGIWGNLAGSPSRKPALVRGAAGQILIWGGTHYTNWPDIPSIDLFRTDGVALDLATNTWSPTSCVGAPPSRLGDIAIGTPTGFIVFGGSDVQNYRYDLDTN